MNTTSPPNDGFLSASDHELIRLIYDAITSKDGFFPFLARFIEVFDGHSAAFTIYDLASGAVAGGWNVNIPEHARSFYAEQVAQQDALLETAMALHQQGTLRFVASNLDIENLDQALSQTPLAAFMSSFEAHGSAGAIVFHNDNHLNFFTVQRSRTQPPFTRAQLAAFDRLLPHLNRAMGLYAEMPSRAAQAFIPERLVLDTLPRGILLCDAHFRVVFRNAMAERLLAGHPEISLSDQALLLFGNTGFSQNITVCLSNAIQASIEQRQFADTVLRYQSGDQNMTIIISPLTVSQGQGAMIGLYDWSLRPAIAPETLRNYFGLTVAEAKVSALLAQGHCLNGIAQQLNRTRETVKSHLKSVFRKTRTSRQGELVALLASDCALG